jgi:hypothetical protein
MRDFRFHVASLIAVFLALGVGMFIGYSIALEIQMDPLKSQIQSVQRTNASVAEDNRQSRQENRDLRDSNIHLRGEVERLATLSVAGRLSGRSVALICVGSPPEPALVDLIWSMLIQAGASRASETIIRGSLQPTDPQLTQDIMNRIHASPDAEPSEAIARALAQAIGSGKDPLLPAALSHRGLPVDPSGSYDSRPDLVVLLSQVNSEARFRSLSSGSTPETPIVQTLQLMGARVVECEPTTTQESGASYFRRLGISSIDNVDSLEGRVSLVWAALGYTGHYGTRQGADSLLPGMPRP